MVDWRMRCLIQPEAVALSSILHIQTQNLHVSRPINISIKKEYFSANCHDPGYNYQAPSHLLSSESCNPNPLKIILFVKLYSFVMIQVSFSYIQQGASFLTRYIWPTVDFDVEFGSHQMIWMQLQTLQKWIVNCWQNWLQCIANTQERERRKTEELVWWMRLPTLLWSCSKAGAEWPDQKRGGSASPSGLFFNLF